MKHKNCGGEILTDSRKVYTDDGWVISPDDAEWDSLWDAGKCHPALRCQKCDKEILGDAEIELENEEEYGI